MHVGITHCTNGKDTHVPNNSSDKIKPHIYDDVY